MLSRAVAVAAITTLGLAAPALADTPSPGTLTAQGQGSVFITPDLGSVNITVNRSAASSAAALSSANARTDAIVAAARALGVPAAQIQTESVSTSCGRVKVGPKHHQRVVRGCSVSESLSVTSAVNLLGRVIDDATRAGASGIDGPSFSFSDPSAGEIAAEHAAIADAQGQADAAAAQLGDTVTGVQSIDLNPQSSSTFSSSGSSSAAAAPKAAPTPTSVNPGTQEVDATVSVVFTIAPATS